VDGAWKVDDQQPAVVVDQKTGRVHDVIRVSFHTRHGHTGSVDVPKDLYLHAANSGDLTDISNRVDAYAKVLDGVAAL
jgi:hypothetical protein